jgi:DNA polymerase III subunit chi
MTEIRFYHLETKPLEQVLPGLLQKMLTKGHRVLLSLGDKTRAAQMDQHLWTFHPETFLPHGLEGEKMAEHQPILISDRPINANRADVLVLYDSKTVPENTSDFAICCDFLDGQDGAAVEHARDRWKTYKSMGHSVTYWQQTQAGGWEKTNLE